jgi:hypothetical protein
MIGIISFLSNYFMHCARKKVIFALSCSISIAASTPSVAVSDPFYEALSKTQSQQYTEAGEELDALGAKFQRRGDRVNAYRSQATAAAIRHQRDYVAENKKNGAGTVPAWWRFGSCWGPGVDAYNGVGGCAFSVEWLQPPTKVKNMGGIITFTNHLEYEPERGSAAINGFLDTAVVPMLKTNETVTSFCKITGGVNRGQSALAVATYDKKQSKYVKIRQAWYTDFQAKRIKSVKPNLVACTSPT